MKMKNEMKKNSNEITALSALIKFSKWSKEKLQSLLSYSRNGLLIT